MSEQPNNTVPPGGTPPPQAPPVVLAMRVTMTADGKIHVGPAADSPRPITLEDVYAFANRMKRDVEVQMQAQATASMVAQIMQQGLVHANTMAQAELAERKAALEKEQAK